MLARMLRRPFNASQNFQIPTFSYFSTSPVAATATSVAATCKENPVLADYLVKSLGFTRGDAILISSKSTLVKSTQKPEQVVDYLKASGFSQSQIRNLVGFHPRVLFHDVEKTLKPKFKVFEDLGVSGSDVRVALSSNPRILRRGLETQILPALGLLKSLFTVPENVLQVLLRSQRILSSNSRKYFPQNVALLNSYGVSMERVRKLTIQGNTFLCRDTKWLKKVLRRVEEELHIPRKLSMFMHAVCVLAALNKETINAKLQVYKSFGWSEEDFYEMIRRLPYTLKTSENTVRVRLKYFMEELGYESGFLASRPVLLQLSTEKRVKPRVHVLKLLKEKQLLKYDPIVSTYTLVKETDFLNKYVLPFDKQVPGLFENYVAMTKSKKGESVVKKPLKLNY